MLNDGKNNIFLFWFYDVGKALAGVLGVCSLANTMLKAMFQATEEKE